MANNHTELTSFIWNIANKLRGPYRPPQYRRVMLPRVVLRRLDCVVEPIKEKMLKEHAKIKTQGHSRDAVETILHKKFAQDVLNFSPFTFKKLLNDPENITRNLTVYIKGFTQNACNIFDKFNFEEEIQKLDEVNRLYIKEILAALQLLDPSKTYKDRDQFENALNKVLQIKLPAPLKKAIMQSLSEHDDEAKICIDSTGQPEADSELRDTELVPLPIGITLPLPIGYEDKTDNSNLLALVRNHCEDYLKREVLPHVSDAWIDHSKTKVGYEIPFNKHFYVYKPPRPLAEIEADIKTLESEIIAMLREVV